MAEKIQTKERERTKTKLKEPGRYWVVMYNDDFTPMDFVVDILMSVFHKTEQEAVRIMMRIHRGTRETVGEYTRDIALTKVDICTRRAREQGYPFLVKAEPKGE